MSEIQIINPNETKEEAELDGLFFNVPEGHKICGACIVYQSKENGSFIVSFDSAIKEPVYTDDDGVVVATVADYISDKILF